MEKVPAAAFLPILLVKEGGVALLGVLGDGLATVDAGSRLVHQQGVGGL